jgi:hypothetical protein
MGWDYVSMQLSLADSHLPAVMFPCFIARPYHYLLKGRNPPKNLLSINDTNE